MYLVIIIKEISSTILGREEAFLTAGEHTDMLKITLRPEKMSPVSGLRARRLRTARNHFYLFLAMSNCSKNCSIDWNSVVLCFKRLFYEGYKRLPDLCSPLLATILCVWEIWSITAYTCIYVFHWLATKSFLQEAVKKL